MKGTKRTRSIEVPELLKAVEEYRAQGYRLVQICCVKQDAMIGFHYTFDKEYDMTDLSFQIPEDSPLMSITPIFPCAFLYENEIHDLFGINIEHMIIDYQGTLYKTRIPAPFGLHPSQPQHSADSATAEGHDD